MLWELWTLLTAAFKGALLLHQAMLQLELLLRKPRPSQCPRSVARAEPYASRVGCSPRRNEDDFERVKNPQLDQSVRDNAAADLPPHTERGIATSAHVGQDMQNIGSYVCILHFNFLRVMESRVLLWFRSSTVPAMRRRPTCGRSELGVLRCGRLRVRKVATTSTKTRAFWVLFLSAVRREGRRWDRFPSAGMMMMVHVHALSSVLFAVGFVCQLLLELKILHHVVQERGC